MLVGGRKEIEQCIRVGRQVRVVPTLRGDGLKVWQFQK